MPGTAEGPAGGRHDRQPQIPISVKGKTCQLPLHGQDGRIVPAVGADQIAFPLFH